MANGTGFRIQQVGGSRGRRLCPGSDPLPVFDRTPTVSGCDDRGDAGTGPPNGARVSTRTATQRAARFGDDHAQMPAQGPRATIRQCCRIGCRPGTFLTASANSCAARRSARTAVRIFRRYPLASTLAASIIGLLLILAVGSLLFVQRLRIANAKTVQSEREAHLGQANALVGRAHGIRLSRRSGQRFEALAAIEQAVEIGRDLRQPPAWFDSIRDEAIAALLLPDVDWDRKWRGPAHHHFRGPQ